MNSTLLEMRQISKSFPGVKALDRVDFEVRAGEVHALLGENGAGKSTLVKILSGALQPDRGEIRLSGEEAAFATTRDAERAGIAIIYQELNLVPQMTVAENIYLGREPRTRFGLIQRTKMKKGAGEELRRLQAEEISVDAVVGQLRIGQQQLVEIAKALSLHARIVIMDEPTSALSESEVEILFRVIKQLQASGVSVIYISHKLDEIFAIAQRVTVLRDGRCIGTREVPQCDAKTLINMMVGRELVELFPKEKSRTGEEILRVEDLSVKHPASDRYLLKGISFSLHRGEILGIAGLMGAGRSELVMTLFGAPPGPMVTGRILIKGRECAIQSPVDAITQRCALVTEDRKVQGLFLQLSVGVNISIASLKKAVRAWLLRRRLEASLVSRYIDQLRIKVPSVAAAVETLSGGNQQKVILAKWMLTDPEILFLDDPTRGIDVGAKAEIYQLMSQFISRGMGIILISSELPEVLAMSDRILVLSQGRITGEFTRDQATEEKIMTAATRSAA